MREFVGCRSMMGEGTDGAIYDMRLTDEEIVRCRDCRHYDHGDAGCMLWVLAGNGMLHVDNPDGYCKWGERKQAEQCEEGI